MSVLSVGELEWSKFKWKLNIDSFNDSLKSNISIDSPIFFTNSTDRRTKWQLVLYPDGKTKEDKGFLSLGLKNLNPHDVSVTYTLSILNQENIIVTSQNTFKFTCHQNRMRLIFRRLIERSYLLDPENNIIKNNCFTILCKIIIEEESEKEIICSENPCRFSEFEPCFERLFTNKEFADVTVKAEGKSIKLHKCILITRSSVFDAMFRSDMKEKKSGIVHINDIKYDVLVELFRFIYTGKVNKIEYLVDKLLVASDKYAIPGLKTLCEKTICDHINILNVIKFLKLAISSNANQLEKFTLNWISLQLESLIATPEFKTFGIEHPELLIRIMEKYVGS